MSGPYKNLSVNDTKVVLHLLRTLRIRTCKMRATNDFWTGAVYPHKWLTCLCISACMHVCCRLHSTCALLRSAGVHVHITTLLARMLATYQPLYVFVQHIFQVLYDCWDLVVI